MFVINAQNFNRPALFQNLYQVIVFFKTLTQYSFCYSEGSVIWNKWPWIRNNIPKDVLTLFGGLLLYFYESWDIQDLVRPSSGGMKRWMCSAEQIIPQRILLPLVSFSSSNMNDHFPRFSFSPGLLFIFSYILYTSVASLSLENAYASKIPIRSHSPFFIPYSMLFILSTSIKHQWRPFFVKYIRGLGIKSWQLLFPSHLNDDTIK